MGFRHMVKSTKGDKIFWTYGLIRFEKDSDAANIMKAMNGMKLYGRQLEVAFTRFPWDVIRAETWAMKPRKMLSPKH